MKTIWKQSLFRAMVWLSAEIILNCVGLDDLADYSEFIFEQKIMNISCNQATLTLSTFTISPQPHNYLLVTYFPTQI